MLLCVPEAWGDYNIWLIRSAYCAEFGCCWCAGGVYRSRTLAHLVKVDISPIFFSTVGNSD